MKRISFLLFAAVLLLTIVACKKATITTGTTTGTTAATTTATTTAGTNGPVTYKDGEYTAEGDKRQYGYENATVTISGGRISQITLRRLSASGVEVNYEDWTGTGDRPNLKQFRLDMAQRMLDAQKPNVDTITGATDSCAGWIIAVDRALQQASA